MTGSHAPLEVGIPATQHSAYDRVAQSFGLGGELSIFRHDGADVRVVVIDGEPWFVAADVARVLGYRMASDFTRRLDEDEKGTHSARTPGGAQDVTIISESGLYVAVIGSQAANARAFKRWVTHDVIPSIRRTGQYIAPTAPALPQSYAEALRELAATVERNEVLEARVAEDAPKVEAYDQLMDADGYYSMESAAKMCGIGRTTLYRRLREAGVIQPGSTLPYQKHMHHFVLTAGSWTDREGNVHPTQTTRVRPAGLAFVLRKIGAEVAP
jgi:prophage antirepressor-like protein